jgi:hypothetical protein
MEFVSLCFSLPVLPFTVLLILVFAYWLLVIVGALTPDSLHIDVDGDVHADIDAGHVDVGHADAGHADAGHAEAGHIDAGGSVLGSVLHFVNVGEVPLMVVASFFIFSLWACTLISHEYLGSTLGSMVSIIMLVPNVIASALVAKVVTTPFKFMFKHMNDGIAAPAKIVGKTCIIKTPSADDRSGQAEMKTDSSPLLLNVRTKAGETLAKGDEALVVAHDPQRDIYTVVKFDLEV